MSATSRSFGAVVVECRRGDITGQPDVDAVVNAANAELAPGGGVAGAIHRVAGPGLYQECRPLAPINTGEAVVTAAHDLPNEWCIHTLGPIYSSSGDPEAELRSCYRNVLDVAESQGLTSLATPAISTGAFGYPLSEAATVALDEVSALAPALERVKLVRFVLWDTRDYDVHVATLERVGA